LEERGSGYLEVRQVRLVSCATQLSRCLEISQLVDVSPLVEEGGEEGGRGGGGAEMERERGGGRGKSGRIVVCRIYAAYILGVC
jgi:hypothetical protein